MAGDIVTMRFSFAFLSVDERYGDSISSCEAGCRPGSTLFKVSPIGDRFRLRFAPFLVSSCY